MSKAPYEIEVVRKVYENDTGSSLTVGPCPDIPENVQVRADGKEDKEWFGDIRFSIPADYAILLAKALLAAADERNAAKDAA